MLQLSFDTALCPHRVNLDSQKAFTKSELTQKANEYLSRLYGCTSFDFYLLHNGKLLGDEQVSDGEVHVVPRLCGGKGGFGSMLRAIGAQIEKTTNREACRDLSGRRLRDINEEKRLKKWIAEQAKREQEALIRKQKKLEKLAQVVKHDFDDEDYTKSRLEMPEKIHDSVEEGLKAAVEEPSCSKDPNPTKSNEVAKKKRIRGRLWVDEDLELLDDSGSNSESESESPKKKAKLTLTDSN